MNIGKLILYAGLFLGAKAFVKKQPASSSAGRTRPGKTNDPYTSEEIAELKKAFCMVEKNPYLKVFIITRRELEIYEELQKRKKHL